MNYSIIVIDICRLLSMSLLKTTPGLLWYDLYLVSGDCHENLWSEKVPMSRRVSHVSRDTVMHHILVTRLLTSHVSVSRDTCDASTGLSLSHHHWHQDTWHVWCISRGVIITPSLTPEHVTTCHWCPVKWRLMTNAEDDSLNSSSLIGQLVTILPLIGQREHDDHYRAQCVLTRATIITLSPDHWTYHRRWLITDNCQLMDTHLAIIPHNPLQTWTVENVSDITTSYLCCHKHIISKHKTTISNSDHFKKQTCFSAFLICWSLLSILTHSTHLSRTSSPSVGVKTFITKKENSRCGFSHGGMAEYIRSRDQWMTNWSKNVFQNSSHWHCNPTLPAKYDH